MSKYIITESGKRVELARNNDRVQLRVLTEIEPDTWVVTFLDHFSDEQLHRLMQQGEKI